ncbi:MULTISPECIES: NIPSNAP family protein [unclassified Variovorax]|uniref:NIPSNAP family protein n=1 Tax=unclassified Variovorax TaxID=663243 RepID=UPI0025774F33|nr:MULTISPECIES: NIPSNAP family protein [unclassified Variovorax]MDM0088219.1 NIPSNAP family protein [Variovorax sp. J22G40]MDM0146292.1 NIPSNAP family protein [Variovorax sp. J2P1-31]
MALSKRPGNATEIARRVRAVARNHEDEHPSQMAACGAVGIKADALRARFLSTTLPIFERLGIHVVSVFAPGAPQGDLWYIVRFDSEAQHAAAWAAFGANEEWRRAKAASEEDGPLLASQKGCLLASLFERAD